MSRYNRRMHGDMVSGDVRSAPRATLDQTHGAQLKQNLRLGRHGERPRRTTMNARSAPCAQSREEYTEDARPMNRQQPKQRACKVTGIRAAIEEQSCSPASSGCRRESGSYWLQAVGGCYNTKAQDHPVYSPHNAAEARNME